MEELHSAYKYILKANENPYQGLAMEEELQGQTDKFDIRHTAPQHRQVFARVFFKEFLLVS